MRFFAFYAAFIASYIQGVICDWIFALISCCDKVISNFGKNEKLNCDFKGIYGIN